MSEDEEGASEEEESSSGPPIGVFVLIAAVIFLVAVSGMFAIGFIPPVLKGASHTTTTSSTRASIQFVTITTAGPAVTSTVSGPAVTSTVTTTTPSVSTSTLTASASTVTLPGSTVTQTETHLVPTTTTTTTTSLTTQTVTTTTTSSGTPPFSVNIAIESASSTFYAADSIVLDLSVVNRIPQTNVSLNIYQTNAQGTISVLNFFPSVPESFATPVGTALYKVLGTFNPHATAGQYEVEVDVTAVSPQNGVTTTNVDQQFLMTLNEPLSFAGYSIPTSSSSQFNGTCKPTVFMGQGNAWIWQCGINAAPGVNGNMTFTVSNLSGHAICIQTSLGSGTLTGYVNMNPYPFCPAGTPGVYVPAGAVNWPFTYLVKVGPNAGAQTIFFTFSR